MRLTNTRLCLPVTVGLGLVLLASACASNAPTAGAPASTSTTTLAMRTVNGASVLVDKSGAALYSNDQDKAGKLQCVASDCTAIWTPLTVPAGTQPTAPSTVSGTLGTVQRPDGAHQVTLNGKPLYTFSFDHGSGKVTGNGTVDSFAGTNFTWQSATPSSSQASAPAAPPANSYPGGY
jgi:predicted lipoprotein with Yx(FWY)xxD motif